MSQSHTMKELCLAKEEGGEEEEGNVRAVLIK